MRDLPAAIAQCWAVLRLNRSCTDAWLWLAEAHDSLGQSEEVMNAANGALALHPEKVEARAKLAYALARLNRLQEAHQEADLSVKLSAKNSAGYLVRGWLRHEQGDLVGAIADYTQATQLLPKKPGTYSSRGFAYHQLGRIAEALADYEAEQKQHPEFALTYNNRGFLFHGEGRFAEALSDYQAAIARDHYHPNAFKNLAWLQSTCPQAEFRDGAAALRNIQVALELDRWRTKAWLEILAAAHAELGDFSEAVRWQSEALASLNGAALELGQTRLQTYQQHQPWREPVARPSNEHSS
jgi:tetratricopeptide (TPR) repeat protein